MALAVFLHLLLSLPDSSPTGKEVAGCFALLQYEADRLTRSGVGSNTIFEDSRVGKEEANLIAAMHIGDGN